MTTEELLFYSLIFSIAAFICAILYFVHDRLCSSEVKETLDDIHKGRSPLSIKYVLRTSIIGIVCYAAIAFTSDPAYTWLASTALLFYFAALLIDRLCADYITARKRKQDEPHPQRRIKLPSRKDKGQHAREDFEFEVSDQEYEQRREELRPEALAPSIANIVLLLADIIMIAAFVDLFILLGVEFFEVVLPHYLLPAVM